MRTDSEMEILRKATLGHITIAEAIKQAQREAFREALWIVSNSVFHEALASLRAKAEEAQ
jgi:hypothetical protein